MTLRGCGSPPELPEALVIWIELLSRVRIATVYVLAGPENRSAVVGTDGLLPVKRSRSICMQTVRLKGCK